MIALFWIGFLVLVFVLLYVDLAVVNKDAHVIPMRAALGWTVFYAVLAVLFAGVVYLMYEGHWAGAGVVAEGTLGGREAALKYLTGWVLEKSLSLDNVFVIALVFSYFRVPLSEQHRVLFWGILGALLMRGGMIGAGAVLVQEFGWIMYVFGGILLFTAVKLLFSGGEEEVAPDKNMFVRAFKRFYPVTPDFHGSNFFVDVDGRRHMTPLFLALVVVESTDLLFAVDSIPAIFAVTTDPFLVFTSNVFAILGLRTLYFALAGLMERFRYVKNALVFILAYVGVKMLVVHHYKVKVPDVLSLGLIAAALTVGVLVSLARTKHEPSH